MRTSLSTPGIPTITDLIARMRRGDRESVGVLIEHYGDRILRHVRMRMSPSVRRVYDSLDVMGSLSRRLDKAISNKQVDFQNERALWGYLRTVAEHVVIDHARVVTRLARVESSDQAIAERLLAQRSRLEGMPHEQIDSQWLNVVIESVEDPTDRFILCSWLAGRQHAQTAIALGISAESVRTRWRRLRARLGERLSSGEFEVGLGAI